MSKLPLLLMLCLMCALEGSFANNFFYYPSSAGAVNYQYPAFSPYVYSGYALPVDCDKNTAEGGEGASTEGGSSESDSSESTEGSSSESSSEETKEGEGSSSEEGGEKKEEGSSEEKKEEGSGEEKKEEKKEGKKEDSKKKVAQYVFPPVSYPYPPQTAQQIVYSAPSYPYMPYKAYSVVQQPASYSLKSSGYNSYPYYSLSSLPVSAGSYSSPISYPGVSKTITFAPASGVGGAAGYWNGNVGYYRV